jgi:hypothetical protein
MRAAHMIRPGAADATPRYTARPQRTSSFWLAPMVLLVCSGRASSPQSAAAVHVWSSSIRAQGLGTARGPPPHHSDPYPLGARGASSKESSGDTSQDRDTAHLFHTDAMLVPEERGILCLALPRQPAAVTLVHGAFNPGLVAMPSSERAIARAVFPTAVYLAALRVKRDQCNTLKRVAQPMLGFISRARQQNIHRRATVYALLDAGFQIVGEVSTSLYDPCATTLCECDRATIGRYRLRPLK